MDVDVPSQALGCSDLDVFVDICQRIRAGWLPHRLSAGSWWWGRPSGEHGFRLWSQGSVPTMSIVDPMTVNEVRVWRASLHPMAAEVIA